MRPDAAYCAPGSHLPILMICTRRLMGLVVFLVFLQASSPRPTASSLAGSTWNVVIRASWTASARALAELHVLGAVPGCIGIAGDNEFVARRAGDDAGHPRWSRASRTIRPDDRRTQCELDLHIDLRQIIQAHAHGFRFCRHARIVPHMLERGLLDDRPPQTCWSGIAALVSFSSIWSPLRASGPKPQRLRHPRPTRGRKRRHGNTACHRLMKSLSCLWDIALNSSLHPQGLLAGGADDRVELEACEEPAVARHDAVDSIGARPALQTCGNRWPGRRRAWRAKPKPPDSPRRIWD